MLLHRHFGRGKTKRREQWRKEEIVKLSFAQIVGERLSDLPSVRQLQLFIYPFEDNVKFKPLTSSPLLTGEHLQEILVRWVGEFGEVTRQVHLTIRMGDEDGAWLAWENRWGPRARSVRNGSHGPAHFHLPADEGIAVGRST